MISVPADNPGNPPIHKLCESLADAEDHVRLSAVGRMFELGPAAAPALGCLTERLSDTDLSVRQLGVRVLGNLGVAAVIPLVRALSERQPTVIRIFAAQGLANMGPPAAPAIEALCDCLESPDSRLRWHASFALGKIGTASVVALRDCLESSNPNVIAAAIESLDWLDIEPPEETSARLSNPIQRL